MPRVRLVCLAAVALMVVPVLAAPPGQGWNYLPNDDIGAVDFKRGPSHLGRPGRRRGHPRHRRRRLHARHAR